MEPHDFELEDQLREAFGSAAAPVRGDGVQLEAVRAAVARRRRNRWRVRTAVIATAAAAAVAVILVTLPDSDERVDTIGRPDRTTSTDVTMPRSGDDERDPPATSSTTADTGTTQASPSTASSATSSSTTSTTSLPEFPAEFTGLTQGGQAWAVYLAIAPPGQYEGPEITAANGASNEAGYGDSGPGDLTCDQGAAEALGRDPASVKAAVYFATQADAAQAQAAFEARGHQVVGIANVTTMCLD
jgi:hypothetical protein